MSPTHGVSGQTHPWVCSGWLLRFADKATVNEIFELVKEIVLATDDALPQTGINLANGNISQRVDNVLEQVGAGKLTPQEGKAVLELLSTGFELTEIHELTEKLKEAGLLK